MTSVDGFATVGIVSEGGALEARFVPDANMLCHSLTHSGDELLHAGRGVEAYAARGKTMGIPLLHPWANRLVATGVRRRRQGGDAARLPRAATPPIRAACRSTARCRGCCAGS